MSFTLFQGIEIFPLREFCKDQNKWTSKGAMSGEYGRWIRTYQVVVTVFAWSSKKQVVLHYPGGGSCVFCWLILDVSLRVLLSVGLSGSSTWICLVFQKELIIKNSFPIPPYTKDHLLWMKTGLWCGWCWFIWLSPVIFHSTLLYSIHFLLSITICFKNGTFPLYFSKDSHVEIQSRRFFRFFFLTYVESNQSD